MWDVITARVITPVNGLSALDGRWTRPTGRDCATPGTASCFPADGQAVGPPPGRSSARSMCGGRADRARRGLAGRDVCAVAAGWRRTASHLSRSRSAHHRHGSDSHHSARPRRSTLHPRQAMGPRLWTTRGRGCELRVDFLVSRPQIWTGRHGGLEVSAPVASRRALAVAHRARHGNRAASGTRSTPTIPATSTRSIRPRSTEPTAVRFRTTAPGCSST